MNRKLLIAVTAAAFVWGLLSQTPAWVLTRFLTPPAGAELYGVQGSLIDGRIDTVAVHGRPLIQALHWTFKPMWLLLGQRVLQLSTESGDTTLDSRVRLSPTGVTTLSPLHARIALTRLLAAAGQTYVPIDGQIDLKLDSARIESGHVQVLTGTGALRGLHWTLSSPQIALGDFEAQATTEKDQIQIQITSPSGPVDAQGQVRLSPDGHYQIDLQYRARPQAETILRNLIAQAGTPDAQGWMHYRSQGQF